MSTGRRSEGEPRPADADRLAGGGGTIARSFDLSDPRDIATIRSNAVRRPKRFRGITDELKDEICSAIKEANRVARSQLTDPDKSLEAAKVVGGLAKTVVAMEALNQKDEHADEGLNVTQQTTQVVVIQPPPSARLVRE